VGQVDGQFGTNSEKALVAFQRDRALSDTGVIDKETVEKLVKLHQQGISSLR
jgi:peptidoglycan hydrolase-like protein with peptidoglycan-binding domain